MTEDKIDYDALFNEYQKNKGTEEDTEDVEEGDVEEGDVEEDDQEEIVEDETTEEDDEIVNEEETEEESEVEADDQEEEETTEEENEAPPVFDINDFTEGGIKSQQELKEVAKVLKDPYFKKVFDYFKAEGTLQPFLQAYSTDYSKLSDIEVLKLKHKEQYEGLDLPEEVIEAAFQKDVASNLVLNPEDHDELDVQIAQAKLKKEAKEARNAFIQRQSEFAEPTREEPRKPTEQELLEKRNNDRRTVQKVLAPILKGNKLSVEVADGVNPVEFDVDPSTVGDAAIDPMNFIVKAVMRDGKTDFKKLSELVVFANDPAAYRSKFYNHEGKVKEFVDKELKNKTTTKGKKPTNTYRRGDFDPYSMEALKAMKLRN